MRHDYRMSEIDIAGGGEPVLRGRFLYNEPMRKHVSWRAGGAAQRVYIPADLEDLTWLVRSVPPREDIHMVGRVEALLERLAVAQVAHLHLDEGAEIARRAMLGIKHHGHVAVVVDRHALSEVVCGRHRNIPPRPGPSGNSGSVEGSPGMLDCKP